MCYSEFTDIITVETSRSGMELLDAFTNSDYPNEIGPGATIRHMVEAAVRLRNG